MQEVIYIMADNRSGSTLLENMLSKSEQCFSVGELALLKGHLLKKGPGERWNWSCSCGKAFNDCSFWAKILVQTNAFTSESFQTNSYTNMKNGVLNRISIFPSLFKSKLAKIASAPKNLKVAQSIHSLYKLIAEQSGEKIIIDSSKNPIQALSIYKNRKDIRIKIIWLKRDLRAIAVSKQKWKSLNNKRDKSLLRLLMDVFYYRRLCYAVSKLVNPTDLIVVNYESLAKETNTTFQSIIQKAGLTSYPTPEFMELIEDHTIGGTPGRFERKPIQYDDKWHKAFKENKFAYFIGSILNKI